MTLPEHGRYVIIGAGVHGLSTAYHLALELKSRGQGDGRDIVVLDKGGVGAGASGIACGVIRNNYFQPAMRELMAHSVEVWESDPEAYSYHPVGYMQISPEAMGDDVATIAAQQKDIGYDSEFIEGEDECRRYMQGFFDDWQAEGITSVLHEKRGGYANNVASMKGLAAKAEGEGVQIFGGVKVTGFERPVSEVRAVITDQGRVECDYVVAAPGPWAKQLWGMLDLPDTAEVNRNGSVTEDPMWTYWMVRETTLSIDPVIQRTNSGQWPPVLHVDSDAPLYSDGDGSLITDQMWGIYYKPDYNFGGVQGGTSPARLEISPDKVKVDPYGPTQSEYVVDDSTKLLWASGVAHCQKRFEGQSKNVRWSEPSGGIGAFTPDSFPIFDVFRENCYFIADSNHGYKMIGVGKLVAGEICGGSSALLEPFRFSRYREGKLHPTSNSPFPWS